MAGAPLLNADVDVRGIGFTSQRTRDRMTARLRARGIDDEAVLATMASVPRHVFVDEAMATRAYEDVALPIGEGQTISQPWVVARMTAALLAGARPQRVLEIGTGSGYQAAVLAALVPSVFTVERRRRLLDRARGCFQRLGYHNIHSRHTDGSWGWASQAPFDAIVVTAAPPGIPPALLEQLAVGGRLVIPVGEAGADQSLTLVTREADGYTARELSTVRFVPFVPGKS